MGRSLAKNGELEQAEILVREAVDLLDATDYLWDRAEARMALADVLRRRDREQDAKRALHEALQLYEQKGHVMGVRRASAALATAQ